VPDWLLGAVALALVFEGLLPFLAPGAWREWVSRMAALTDGQIRFIGLASLLTGAGLLVWSRM